MVSIDSGAFIGYSFLFSMNNFLFVNRFFLSSTPNRKLVRKTALLCLCHLSQFYFAFCVQANVEKEKPSNFVLMSSAERERDGFLFSNLRYVWKYLLADYRYYDAHYKAKHIIQYKLFSYVLFAGVQCTATEQNNQTNKMTTTTATKLYLHEWCDVYYCIELSSFLRVLHSLIRSYGPRVSRTNLIELHTHIRRRSMQAARFCAKAHTKYSWPKKMSCEKNIIIFSFLFFSSFLRNIYTYIILRGSFVLTSLSVASKRRRDFKATMSSSGSIIIDGAFLIR